MAIDYNAAFTGAVARLVDFYSDMQPFSDCTLDLGWSHKNATLVRHSLDSTCLNTWQLFLRGQDGSRVSVRQCLKVISCGMLTVLTGSCNTVSNPDRPMSGVHATTLFPGCSYCGFLHSACRDTRCQWALNITTALLLRIWEVEKNLAAGL